MKVAPLNNNAFVHSMRKITREDRIIYCHKGVTGVYYDKIRLKFASHHFLLYS